MGRFVVNKVMNEIDSRLTLFKLMFAGELESMQRFLGNESHKDHFKLLEKDQNSLLVGAR